MFASQGFRVADVARPANIIEALFAGSRLKFPDALFDGGKIVTGQNSADTEKKQRRNEVSQKL